MGSTGLQQRCDRRRFPAGVVADGDLRELVGNLITHHLRRSGKMETVSGERVQTTPDPLVVRKTLTGQRAAVEAPG